MTTKPFKLYKITIVNGRYEKSEEEVLIDTIDVNVNEQHLKSYTNEIQYLVKVVTGLTQFKSFDVNCKYILIGDNCKYEIQSFIIGRWTQLQLKQVIV